MGLMATRGLNRAPAMRCLSCPRTTSAQWDGLPRHGVRGRQPDGEFASQADPFTRRVYSSAMHLDEAFHEREPDPEPAPRPMRRRCDLGEHLENAGKYGGRDAFAIVPNPYDVNLSIGFCG